MKQCIISLALMATLMPMADAETIWAEGVDQNGGWYDANKIDETNQMCYAAVASNLIAWWQDKYVIPSNTPSGIDKITGYNTQNGTDVWSTFVDNALINGGFNVPYAINWYLTGDDLDWNETLSKFDGYYSSVIPAGTTLYVKSDTSGAYFIQRYTATSENILSVLNSKRAAALELNGHSITLWGAEVSDGSISSIYVTDSDDFTGSTELMKLAVTTNANGTLKFKFSETDSKSYNTVTLYTITPTISDTWGLERIPSTGGDTSVPEPTTATLSLLALASLAMRRRRK